MFLSDRGRAMRKRLIQNYVDQGNFVPTEIKISRNAENEIQESVVIWLKRYILLEERYIPFFEKGFMILREDKCMTKNQ